MKTANAATRRGDLNINVRNLSCLSRIEIRMTIGALVILALPGRSVDAKPGAKPSKTCLQLSKEADDSGNGAYLLLANLSTTLAEATETSTPTPTAASCVRVRDLWCALGKNIEASYGKPPRNADELYSIVVSIAAQSGSARYHVPQLVWQPVREAMAAKLGHCGVNVIPNPPPGGRHAWDLAEDGFWVPELAARYPAASAVHNANSSAAEKERMIKVPAADFAMGCQDLLGTRCAQDMKPQHQVHVAEFYLDRTEVTVKEFRLCIDAGGCSKFNEERMQAGRKGYERRDNGKCNWFRDERDQHPMNCVTWQQADEYCSWAGKRLPTEAEWERAARGPGNSEFPWGREPPTCARAIFRDRSLEGCQRYSTWPVGSKPKGASPLGVVDMIGNVSEWVSDWYQPTYYDKSPRRDPKGPEEGTERVIRGASFTSDSKLRANDRFSGKPEAWFHSVGFRCAKDVENSDPKHDRK